MKEAAPVASFFKLDLIRDAPARLACLQAPDESEAKNSRRNIRARADGDSLKGGLDDGPDLSVGGTRAVGTVLSERTNSSTKLAGILPRAKSHLRDGIRPGRKAAEEFDRLPSMCHYTSTFVG
jgi:hypothetical protein